MSYLGIDIGTTSVKAVVLDGEGSVRASTSLEYPTAFRVTGEVEQAPEDWWRCVVAALRELATLVGGLADVEGIGVSAQAPTLIALDAAGAPVRDALIWMDRRAQPWADALAREHDEAAYIRERGNRIDPFFLAPKLMWMRDAEPEEFARSRHFLQITGYIVFRLTGVLSLDDQHASLLALRATGDQDWSADALAEAGIPADALPPVHAATDVVGGVSSDVAALIGVRPGTPVVAGTVDSAAAAIEVGALRPGVAAEMTGTSTVLVMPSDAPRPDRAFITMSSPAGGWFSLAAVVASGASLKWLRDIALVGADYTAVTELAAQAALGASGVRFVPHLMGERSPVWDSDRRGTITGLTLATGIGDLARAVLEGTAMALRHNLAVAADAGIRPAQLRATGAPTRSDLWCQIKADATGIPLHRVRNPTGAAYGAAVLAGVGVGAVSDLAAFDGEERIDRVFEPQDAVRDEYDEMFAQYLEIVDALEPVQHRMAVPR